MALRSLMSLLAPIVFCVWLGACGTLDGDAAALLGGFEGANAGECSDGDDNDLDGFTDCEDQSCWDSEDCAASGDDDDYA